MNETTRVTVTLKLRPGKDDDLILWWQSTAPGKRNRLLRQIMRVYVSGVAEGETEQQQLARIAGDTAWLRAALAALPAQLAQLVAHLGGAAVEVRPAASRQDPNLSEAEVERRAQRMARAIW